MTTKRGYETWGDIWGCKCSTIEDLNAKKIKNKIKNQLRTSYYRFVTSYSSNSQKYAN